MGLADIKVHPEIDKLMTRMWNDITIANQQRAIELAKADPEKYKLSKLIADNKPVHYYYRTAIEQRGRRRRIVRWCWAQYPNIAGYFLSWRQVENTRSIKRTQFKAHKHRYLGEMRADKMIKREEQSCTIQNAKS